MLIKGQLYKRIDGKQFSFGEKQGWFMGHSKSGWPRFKLSGKKQCAINLTDGGFELKTSPTNERTPVGDVPT